MYSERPEVLPYLAQTTNVKHLDSKYRVRLSFIGPNHQGPDCEVKGNRAWRPQPSAKLKAKHCWRWSK